MGACIAEVAQGALLALYGKKHKIDMYTRDSNRYTFTRERIYIQRNFLWGWGSEVRKIAWVKWEIICKTKEVGGLGIRDIQNFNTALLVKWKWRLGTEDNGLWKQVIESKYGSWRNLNDPNISRFASRWWKDINKVCGSTTQGLWFDKSFEWVVGEGRKVKFWEDNWIGEATLKCRFHRLYSLSECRDMVIGDVGH